MENGSNKYVDEIPLCDLCDVKKINKATVDGKTIWGHWAYMCSDCYITHGVGLGLGLGQFLKKRE